MKQKCLGFKTSIQATFKPDSCKLLLVESIKCDSGKYGIIRPEKWVKKQLQTGQQVKSFISTTNVCKENYAGRSIDEKDILSLVKVLRCYPRLKSLCF